jgi:acetolactate synthase I/II/III large subunit
MGHQKEKGKVFQKSGAEILCESMERLGVEVVFGIPGMHNLHLFEALRRSRIRLVWATHEQALGFMANGYYRASGNTGFFITVPGPGLTNSFTAIAESLLDSCAVVGIVTGVNADVDENFQVHAIRQVELAQPIVKSIYCLDRPGQIEDYLNEAVDYANQAEPGPVLLEIPENVLRSTPSRKNKFPDKKLIETPELNDLQIDSTIEKVKRAERVGLFVGQGALHAAEKVLTLAEWLTAPVMTTLSGRGCLPENHPLSLGFGWKEHGTEQVNQILASCDLVLVIGAKLSEQGTHSYKIRFTNPVIHVDSSADVLSANQNSCLAICSDSDSFLNSLLQRKTEYGPRKDDGLIRLLDEMRCVAPEKKHASEIKLKLGSRTYSAEQFFKILRNQLVEEDILVTDSGFHRLLAIENYSVFAPRTLITPSDYQAMGFGISAAIGAALARPRVKVIALVGDGSFAMSGFEFTTAQREDLDLTIIVFNDGCFGIIKDLQDSWFGAHHAVGVRNPDFKLFAESFQIPIFIPDEADPQPLETCLLQPGLSLVDVSASYPQRIKITRVGKRWKRDVKQLIRNLIRKPSGSAPRKADENGKTNLPGS